MAFVSIGVALIIQKSIVRWRMLTTSLLCIAILYLGMYSYVLNKELWHDEDTFFDQEVVRFKNYLYAGGLAENLLDTKRYQEAERYFRIAINKYPHEAKNYINYSALLLDTGRPNDALLYLKKSKALFMTQKERGEWFNNNGMAYFNLKENDNALKSFKKAILFSPNESQFWANLGGAYGSIGAYRNSIAVLENGLALFPDSELLRKNLGVSYYHVGEYAKAISVLEKIPLESRQKDPGITRLIKEVHQKVKTGSHL
jgi:tetratricopeptide (TPR) repeat protein